MTDTMTLYLDDSGSRDPDRLSRTKDKSGPDWFGLGGVILRDADRPVIDAAHEAFCSAWGITEPLHSNEIRQSKKPFEWIGRLDRERKQQFFDQLNTLATSRELTAIACVIDRPGYNARYRARYGRARWQLCKTAFHVVVERAAKFALRHRARLRVYVEKSGAKIDRRIEQYYRELRENGLPFDGANSAKYQPLTKEELRRTLFEFKLKEKTSVPVQLADLVLYPMCIGGYNPAYKSYVALRGAGTLVDCKVPSAELKSCGIKYSCWELQSTKTPKPGREDQALGQPPTATSWATPTEYSSELLSERQLISADLGRAGMPQSVNPKLAG